VGFWRMKKHVSLIHFILLALFSGKDLRELPEDSAVTEAVKVLFDNIPSRKGDLLQWSVFLQVTFYYLQKLCQIAERHFLLFWRVAFEQAILKPMLKTQGWNEENKVWEKYIKTHKNIR